MKKENDKYSDNKILEIIVTFFVASVMVFLFIKIMFF